MDCKSCKDLLKQQEGTMDKYTFETMMLTIDATIKRLWIVIIILIVLLAGSNAARIWYESQFEVVETEITQEADGNGSNNYIGNDGDIYNGTTDNQDAAQGS